MPCTVVVPIGRARVKVAALRDLGAQVHRPATATRWPPRQPRRWRMSRVPCCCTPYDLPDIVAGAGTIAPELAADVEGPLTIVTCGRRRTDCRPDHRDAVRRSSAPNRWVHRACIRLWPRSPDTELDSIAADSLGATEVGGSAGTRSPGVTTCRAS